MEVWDREQDKGCLTLGLFLQLSQYSKSNLIFCCCCCFVVHVVVYYSSQLLNTACLSLTMGHSRRVCECMSQSSHTLFYIYTFSLFNGWWGFNQQRLMVTYLLIGAFPASTPLPHQHCWREPCNNFACFHDNHLLLSPHPSTSSSHPSLPLFPHSHLSLFSLHTVGISRSKRVIAR